MIDSSLDFLFQGSCVIGLSQAYADSCPSTAVLRDRREGSELD